MVLIKAVPCIIFLKEEGMTCQESEGTLDISIVGGRGLLEEVLRFLAFGSSEVDIMSKKMKRQL